MTIPQILANGWVAPATIRPYVGLTANVMPEIAAYKISASQMRFHTLLERYAIRASNLRAAGRRYRRKVGLPLNPLPFASKYRTKGRR